MPATSGEATLVPPTSPQLPSIRMETGVTTAATAAMSLSVRLLQPLSVCHLGLGLVVQPLPVPPLMAGSFQTSSNQPRAVSGTLNSAVPPTATTFGEDAGKSVVWKPSSKYASA